MPSPDELTYEPSTFDRNGHVIDWRVCRRDDGRTMAITYQENITRDVCGLIRIVDGDVVWPTRKVRGPAGEANPCNRQLDYYRASPVESIPRELWENSSDILAGKPSYHVREAPAGYPPLLDPKPIPWHQTREAHAAPPGKAVQPPAPPPLPRTLAQLVVALTHELAAVARHTSTPTVVRAMIQPIIDDLNLAALTTPDQPCV